MFKHYFETRLSAIFLPSLILLSAFAYSAAVVAALPQVESTKSYLMVVAAIGNAGNSEPGSNLKDYRVRRPTVEDYQFTEAVLAVMLKKIDVNKGHQSTISELNQATPGQKALYAVQMLRVTVTELGFIGYLESEYGNLIPEAKRGLKILGAKEYLKVLDKALSVFKKEKTLITDSRNRKEVLNRLSNEDKYKIFDPVDEKFEEFEDKLLLQNYIIKYVNNNPKHFFVN